MGIKRYSEFINESYFESRKPVKGYVDADDLVGERLWFHTNRTHRNNKKNGMIGVYGSSINGLKGDFLGKYTNEVRIRDVIFQAPEKGADYIKDNKKRTLIAGVSGTVIPTNNNTDGMVEITYNPFDVGYFHRIDDIDKKKIVSGGEVYFNAIEAGEWNIFIKDPVYSESINEEIGSKRRKDTWVVYKGKNSTVLVPKSVESAESFSKQTAWCTTSQSMFDYHEKQGDILFRIFLKDERARFRLTWGPKGFTWGLGGKGTRYVVFSSSNMKTPWDFDGLADHKKDNRWWDENHDKLLSYMQKLSKGAQKNINRYFKKQMVKCETPDDPSRNQVSDPSTYSPFADRFNNRGSNRTWNR